MVINPHKLGVHKVLQHIPLNKVFDAPAKARLAKAVNIADLRLCAKQRAHKVSFEFTGWGTNLGYGHIMCFVRACAGIVRRTTFICVAVANANDPHLQCDSHHIRHKPNSTCSTNSYFLTI